MFRHLERSLLGRRRRGRKEERRAREAREDQTREDHGKQNSQKFELSSCNKMEEQKEFNKPLFLLIILYF